MHRMRGTELHPANVAAVGVGRGYGSKADPPGTIRVAVEDPADSPYGNMQYSPGVPIGNVQHTGFTFVDDSDLDTIDVRKTTGSGGTTAGIINGRGGGIIMVNGSNLNDMTMVESKNAIAGLREGAEVWLKYRVKVSGNLLDAGDNVFVGIMEKEPGGDVPDQTGIDGYPNDLDYIMVDFEVDRDGYPPRVGYNTRGTYDGTPSMQASGFGATSAEGKQVFLNDGNWHNINMHITPEPMYQGPLDFADENAPRRRVEVFIDDMHVGGFTAVVPGYTTDLVLTAGIHKSDPFGGGVGIGKTAILGVQEISIIQEEDDTP